MNLYGPGVDSRGSDPEPGALALRGPIGAGSNLYGPGVDSRGSVSEPPFCGIGEGMANLVKKESSNTETKQVARMFVKMEYAR